MKKTRITRNILSVFLLCIFLGHALGIINLPLLDTLELKAYDYRVNLTTTSDVEERIVIIDIDEASLEEFGRWPWSRNKLAQLIDNLFDHYFVAVAGFDIIFAEPDLSSGLQVLDALGKARLISNSDYLKAVEEIRDELEYDTLFSKAITDRAVVLGYYFSQSSNKDAIRHETEVLPEPALIINDETNTIPFITANDVGSNLAVFQKNALHGGFIDLPTVDEDGVIRKIPMLQKYDGALYESFSLAMVRALMGFPKLKLFIAEEYAGETPNLGLEQFELGGFSIPVDESGSALIPYRGPFGSFTYVSAKDVINKTVEVEELEDTIVLIGTTAPGLLDIRSTPVQNIYPGVEIHANLIAGILDGNIKNNPAYIHGFQLVSLIIIWIVMTIITSRPGVMLFILSIGFLAALIIGTALYAWDKHHLVLPVATKLVFISVLLIYYLGYSYFVENRSKRQLTKVFRQYIPSELVDELGDQEDDYAIEGETREMTVLFADIRGFTSLSEHMQPKELTKLMNCYLTGMTQGIQMHRGTIDKYIGDAIMAFWGAPLHDKKHAALAVDGALEMLNQLHQLEPAFKKNRWPILTIGIGVTSGSMYVGNIGSKFRMSYTVLGDTVNLGSRIESLTKHYKIPIIVSENTKQACPDHVFMEIDRVRVIGKEEAVTIYQPIARENTLDSKVWGLLSKHDIALKLYRKQRWREAINLFGELFDETHSSLYQIYIERCMLFQQSSPPREWDGIYRVISK